MPPGRPALPSVEDPLTDLTDQRVVQILSTEHWSLLSSRSLAYNEAFTRGGMFLTFLSSFVALALFSTAMSFGDDFLILAAIVLAFDFIIGLLDLRAYPRRERRRPAGGPRHVTHPSRLYPDRPDHDAVLHGRDARRHRGRHAHLRSAPNGRLRGIVYGLTTSGGMIGLIICMVGGVFARRGFPPHRCLGRLGGGRRDHRHRGDPRGDDGCDGGCGAAAAGRARGALPDAGCGEANVGLMTPPRRRPNDGAPSAPGTSHRRRRPRFGVAIGATRAVRRAAAGRTALSGGSGRLDASAATCASAERANRATGRNEEEHHGSNVLPHDDPAGA